MLRVGVRVFVCCMLKFVCCWLFVVCCLLFAILRRRLFVVVLFCDRGVCRYVVLWVGVLAVLLFGCFLELLYCCLLVGACCLLLDVC